jgi:chromosome segregation ATPase
MDGTSFNDSPACVESQLRDRIVELEEKLASKEEQRVALEAQLASKEAQLSSKDQRIQHLKKKLNLERDKVEDWEYTNWCQRREFLEQRSLLHLLARTCTRRMKLRHFIPYHPDPSARIEGMVEQRQGATLQDVANGAAAAAPSDRREQQGDAASEQRGARAVREPVASSLTMSNEDIAEGLKVSWAGAREKVAELFLQLDKHKDNEPEAGTAEHRSYKKALVCLEHRLNNWKLQLEFLDDQALFLKSIMGDSLENPIESASILEDFAVQLRMAKEVTKLLCDLVKEGEALELQLMEMTPSQHGNYRDLKDRLRAVTADLGRFDSAIGGDENTRPRFYIDMIMGPPDEGSDDEASDDEASDDEASDDGASDDGASDDEASDDEASDDGAPRKRIRRTSVGTASPRASQIA